MQYLALGVLAAIILVGLVPIVGPGFENGISQVICRIIHVNDGTDCEKAPGSQSKIDINPQWCLSSMSAEGYNAGINFLVFHIGKGFKEIRYDSREEDFDGKVKHYIYVAYVNSGDVGIDVEKAAKGAKVDVGEGLTLNYGDMYRLTPEQYQKFHDGIELWQTYLQALQNPAPGGMGDGGAGLWYAYQIMAKKKGLDWPPKMAVDPAITFGETNHEGKGEGTIPINGDKKLSSPGKYLLPNGASIATKQGGTVTTEHWYIYKDAKGNILPATATYHTSNSSYTFKVQRKGTKENTDEKGGANAGVSASETLDFTNTTRVTRDDKTGKLRNIRYVITYGDKGSIDREVGVNGKKRGEGKKSAGGSYDDTHSSGKLHTEVIQLNFDLNDDANQKIGEDWLKNHGTEVPPEVANQVFPQAGITHPLPDDKNSAGAPPADADPFDKLIYDRAMGWKTDAETKEQAEQLKVMLPIWKGVGFYGSLNSQEAKTMKAQILDAPGSDGQRHWINYPDCTAAGNH